ncbi:hypothetical protein C8J57DRAFT_1509242 [Mycena rebaudengoi]|nr:hypothetical protein C8J57DRAFT_1509242 [Mycena rebaudengoi]
MSRRPGRLNALFDTPSSPLAPPSSDTINGATDTPFGSPQRPNPVTPSNSARCGSSSSPYASARSAVGSLGQRTVHTEDFSQHGTLIAARLHLKPDAVKQLEDFVKMATSRSEVSMYGQLLKIAQMQAAQAPGPKAWVIPKKLEDKIDTHSFRILMSPSIPADVKKTGMDSPSGQLRLTCSQALIVQHPGWGVTADQLDDKEIWWAVLTRSCGRLTDRRYDIKKECADSLWIFTKSEDGETIVTDRQDPLDIVKLCENLVDPVPDAGVKVTLPMLGRVALLRQVLLDVSGRTNFWDQVDQQLAHLRKKYDHDEARISKAIGKVLKNNCRTYSTPNLTIFQ